MNFIFITLTVLQSLLAILEQKTLISEFTISMAEQNSQPLTYMGDLSMHGKQFALSMFAIEAAYDGQTLYMYSEDTEELTISTPTEEELLQTNPFLYAQSLLPLCQYSEKVIGDKTQVTLTPVNNSLPISKFVLRVTTLTNLPAIVEIYEKSGKTTTLRLTNPKYTDSIPTFFIEKEGAYINDLR